MYFISNIGILLGVSYLACRPLITVLIFKAVPSLCWRLRLACTPNLFAVNTVPRSMRAMFTSLKTTLLWDQAAQTVYNVCNQGHSDKSLIQLDKY